MLLTASVILGSTRAVPYLMKIADHLQSRRSRNTLHLAKRAQTLQFSALQPTAALRQSDYPTMRIRGANMLLDRAMGGAVPRAQHCSRTCQSNPVDSEPMNYFQPHQATHTRDKANAKGGDSPEFWHRSVSSAHSKPDHAGKASGRGGGRPR